MLRGKSVFTTAFFASMTLLVGMSYADTETGSTKDQNGNAPVVTQPPIKPKDDVRFKCEFFGVFPGKTKPAGSMACRAHGQVSVDRIQDFFFTTPDADDFLKFTCRDRDDEPYYSGPPSYGVAPAIVDADGDNGDGRLFNTIITGIKTTAPIIVIQGVNLKHLRHDGSSDSSSDGRSEIVAPAAVQFNWFGVQTQIPGLCELHVEHHGSAPVPPPAL